MGTQFPTEAKKSSVATDSRRTHRKVVVVCGALAIIGAALAAFVHPALAILAVIGGLVLLVYPDQKS
jgi:hypothetical protein